MSGKMTEYKDAWAASARRIAVSGQMTECEEHVPCSFAHHEKNPELRNKAYQSDALGSSPWCFPASQYLTSSSYVMGPRCCESPACTCTTVKGIAGRYVLVSSM